MSKIDSFESILGTLAHTHDLHKVFPAFLKLTACTLACQTREEEYLDEAKYWKKENLKTFAQAMAALILQMEKAPFTDLLGTYYMNLVISKGAQQHNGEFHTPQEICRLIGGMLTDSDALPESGPITICEPACGSGAMILALAEQYGPANIRRLRVTAIDINRMACDMCFINTTLWGIPTHVIHGDSLCLKFKASWKNIHWIAPFLLPGIHAPEDAVAAAAAMPSGQGAPPSPEETAAIRTALGQQMFDFS
jgi:hypothetical protein